MKNPLTGCTYDRVYRDLKGFSKNGDNFCKQLMSVLQQRANLEISYAKGLKKQANKLTKALDKMKKGSCREHLVFQSNWQWMTLSSNVTVFLSHKLDTTVEKAANVVINNWSQQIKAKKKLMGFTKEHEALFHHVEDTKQLSTEKTRQKLLKNLEKSTTKLTKEDEEYYQKNLAGSETRLKWEAALETCYQSILHLEQERLQLLCNILNRYNQHLSSFGQHLTTCHAQIHTAVSKVDAEKDIQTLLKEMTVSSVENKSEFLLTDYYEEDSNNVMEKERRKAAIKAKILRLQKDLEKATQDKKGVERMLTTFKEMPQFSDTQNQRNTDMQLDETNLKISLLQANYFKLATTLAEMEQTPKPTGPLGNCVSRWKEKVKAVNALYDYHAKRDDELSLEKGDVIIIHQKHDDGWWYGTLQERKGHFPASYVEDTNKAGQERF
uniref:Nitric oxide synthase trafficking n=1 Tax=Sphenodon punctatus TaxID=8508 RepID=A0A8D0L6C5_SPHPU